MAGPTAFTVSGTASYPPDDGQPVAPIPFSMSGSFDVKVDQEVPFTGAGNFTVTIPVSAKAKLLLIEMDTSTSTTPVVLTFNGGANPIEIKPGGFLVYGNPAPSAAGFASFTFTHTADGKIRVRALA